MVSSKKSILFCDTPKGGNCKEKDLLVQILPDDDVVGTTILSHFNPCLGEIFQCQKHIPSSIGDDQRLEQLLELLLKGDFCKELQGIGKFLANDLRIGGVPYQMNCAVAFV